MKWGRTTLQKNYSPPIIIIFWKCFFNSQHCVKSVHIRSFSGPYFPAFGLNTDKNSIRTHFTQCISCYFLTKFCVKMFLITFLLRNEQKFWFWAFFFPPYSRIKFIIKSDLLCLKNFLVNFKQPYYLRI